MRRDGEDHRFVFSNRPRLYALTPETAQTFASKLCGKDECHAVQARRNHIRRWGLGTLPLGYQRPNRLYGPRLRRVSHALRCATSVRFIPTCEEFVFAHSPPKTRVSPPSCQAKPCISRIENHQITGGYVPTPAVGTAVDVGNEADDSLRPQIVTVGITTVWLKGTV